MRRNRYLILLLAIYLIFVGGSNRYVILYQVRVFHHIIVTVLISLWLIHRIRHKKGIPSTPFNLPLFALIGVWLITALTSIDPRMAFEHIWFPYTFVILFFMVLDYFQRGRGKIIMETFFFIMIVVIALTGLELASWYFGLGILPDTDVSWFNAGILIPPYLPRVSMAMGISTLLAGFTVPTIFITATWAMTVRQTSHRRVLWIIAFLLFLTLILTFSRGGLLAFLGGLTALFIIRAIQHPALTSRVSPKLIGGVGATLAIGVLALFTLMTLPYAIGKSDEGRLDMWQSAVKITLDHPISGVGPGLFGRAYRDYRDPLVGRDKLAAAHNLYLNTASELGIPGIMVGIWLVYTVCKTSWHTWNSARGKNQHLRVEGMFVALVALAIHSTVDVFTITPINLVCIVIVAYLATGQRSILDPLPDGQMRSAFILLGLTLIFGAALLQWDRAQGLFQSSFGKPANIAIPLIEQAQEIDPYLKLYQLHKAFLLGQQANDTTSIEQAIIAYENALLLEPTWDVGWVNLAWLELQRDNPEQALEYLQIAHNIYPLNSAIFAMARTADIHQLQNQDSVIDLYRQALRYVPQPHLPHADIWWNTPASTRATETYLSNLNIEQQYRVYSQIRPEAAQSLVPENPHTAVEWWVVGANALASNNHTIAEEAFTRAIKLNPVNGDYYVSRARSRLDQLELARHDLELARLYGTFYEYPNALLANLVEDETEKIILKATALPYRANSQEFAAVLYARPAVFDVPGEMRFPGPGEVNLSPWYEIAEMYRNTGNIDQAVRAYQIILDVAPYEKRARNNLAELVSNP